MYCLHHSSTGTAGACKSKLDCANPGCRNLLAEKHNDSLSLPAVILLNKMIEVSLNSMLNSLGHDGLGSIPILWWRDELPAEDEIARTEAKQVKARRRRKKAESTMIFVHAWHSRCPRIYCEK